MIVLSLPTAVYLVLQLIMLPQITRWHASCNQHVRPLESSGLACIEKPYTMHGARHTAGFRCIHEQSRCQRPHEILGSPWARSAICREWNQRHWEESKTSKRGQCENQWGVGHETRFNKDNWESTYFMIFWKSWNWPLYSRECLQYWLH